MAKRVSKQAPKQGMWLAFRGIVTRDGQAAGEFWRIREKGKEQVPVKGRLFELFC